jgi:phosphatidylserine decarboxylase
MPFPYALLPGHALSRAARALARSRALAPALNALFVRAFRPDLAEAEPPEARAYPTFAALFTRPLRPGARPLAGGEEVLVAPADGALGPCGIVQDGTLLQAKGRRYSAAALLGGDRAYAERFTGGIYATVYLAPRDYHRVHLPLAGQLTRLDYLPGRLLPVHPRSAAGTQALYARNERAVCRFETAWGPLAVVLVGALLVSGIALVWHGDVNPYGARARAWWQGYDPPQPFARGAELGRFEYGSTVVALAPPALRLLPGLGAGRRVRMGEALARA